jgi:hypothetical protein
MFKWMVMVCVQHVPRHPVPSRGGAGKVKLHGGIGWTGFTQQLTKNRRRIFGWSVHFSAVIVVESAYFSAGLFGGFLTNMFSLYCTMQYRHL